VTLPEVVYNVIFIAELFRDSRDYHTPAFLLLFGEFDNSRKNSHYPNANNKENCAQHLMCKHNVFHPKKTNN